MDKKKLKELSRNLVANETDFMHSFRRNLSMYLAEKSITKQKLAEKSGVSEGTLKTIMYGHHNDCKLSTAVALSKALGVTIDELIGSGTINQETRESVYICRNLPENSIHLIRWFIRHQEIINRQIPKEQQYINVMRPELCNDGNIKASNTFDHVLITDLPMEVRGKVFMGIQLPCDYYMPVYSPYDILLIANDREPIANEKSVLIRGDNLYLAKMMKVDGVKKFFSIRDGKFRVNADDVQEILGYIAATVIDPECYERI